MKILRLATGVLDVNGEEIYEDDIVITNGSTNDPGNEIIIFNGKFAFYNLKQKRILKSTSLEEYPEKYFRIKKYENH